MSVVALKLLGLFAVVSVGWVAGRTRLLAGADAARTLSNVAFFVFTPALLFRTTARVDLASLPWASIAVFFGPVVALLLVVYGWQRVRQGPEPAYPAAAAVRAISTTFGNTVQLGIPVVAALFGEAGLSVQFAIVSLHALTLLTILTVLVELDLARAHVREKGDGPPLASRLALTARNTIVHPVVLPVLVGLGWNLLGLPLAGPFDELLRTLAQAVVPVCLVTLGVSLAHYGIRGVGREAAEVALGKLAVQPLLVLAVAHWGAGLRGLPLAVVVLCAALPTGSNALLFAQRYSTAEAETTAATVVSTLAFVATGPLWLLVVGAVAP